MDSIRTGCLTLDGNVPVGEWTSWVLFPVPKGQWPRHGHAFFLLHAAKVRSSYEEGPGQSALQSAYHDPKLDVTELKQNRTSEVVQAKNCKQTN